MLLQIVVIYTKNKHTHTHTALERNTQIKSRIKTKQNVD